MSDGEERSAANDPLSHAQRIAERFGCTVVTRQFVEDHTRLVSDNFKVTQERNELSSRVLRALTKGQKV